MLSGDSRQFTKSQHMQRKICRTGWAPERQSVRIPDAYKTQVYMYVECMDWKTKNGKSTSRKLTLCDGELSS